MRLLLLSFAVCVLVSGAIQIQAVAQNTGDNENTPQLPVGQTFKQFTYPVYQDGKLKATLSAVSATGITLNRAATTDLEIDLYDNGIKTTTITSPTADLYVNEQKMRTKNTVLIVRDDMTASSQDCDFDLKTKKYVLRANVKVLLKHFDLSATPANGAATPPASTNAPGAASPAPDASGSSASTNSAPIPPTSTDAK